MDARAFRNPQGFPRALNVGPAGARQAGDDRSPYRRRNRLNRLEVAIGGNGEPGLDHVDAETVELVSQAQLFLLVHAAARRLFTVAKSRVKYRNACAIRGHNLLIRMQMFHGTRRAPRSKTYNSSAIIRYYSIISSANIVSQID